MRAIEAQIRVAIRDAVNRGSRKPFHWGGLTGYQQLHVMAQELHRVPSQVATEYVQQLTRQVDRVLEKNQTLAEDLRQAHLEVERIAACLRYPARSDASPLGGTATSPGPPVRLTGSQVAAEMQDLLQHYRPSPKYQPAQAALRTAWQRLWQTWGPELLPCYDVPGLPPDNLRLEGLFGCLRRHQRRISGCKSTPELRDLGHYQVLFRADSEEELLQQLQQVPLTEYQAHCRRLSEAEAPRRFLHHLHHDPGGAMKRLIDKHMTRRAELAHHQVSRRATIDHTI